MLIETAKLRVGTLSSLMCLVGAGCTSSASTTVNEDKGKAVQGSADGVSLAGGPKRGLAAPSNHPEVVELARGVMNCEWKDNLGFASPCPGLSGWAASELHASGEADTTLLAMLRDTDEKIRWLGASAILGANRTDESGRSHVLGTGNIEQVLGAAQLESNPAVAEKLADVIARLDLRSLEKSVSLTVEDLLVNHRLETMRGRLAEQTLHRNPQFADEVALSAQADTSIEVRRHSMDALGTVVAHSSSACRTWREHARKDVDPSVSAQAAALVAKHQECRDDWEEVLFAIDARVKTWEVQSSEWSVALGHILRQDESSVSQRKHAVQIAKAIVKNKANGEAALSEALQLVGAHDPRASKLAKRYLDDPSFVVRNSAQNIVRSYRERNKK